MRTKDRKTKIVEYSGSLAFLEKQWLNLVLVDDMPGYVNRKAFEVSIFSALVDALKSGDIFVIRSEEFADYRKQLLPWSECQGQLKDYFAEVSLPGDAKSFANHTKESLRDAILKADRAYKKQRSYSIDGKGVPSVSKPTKTTIASTVRGEQELVLDHMPERTLIEILCNTHHWINWTRHFGPLWGGDAKMDEATERYILTTFAYGANLGATQTAKHYYKPIHPDSILLVNRQHSSIEKLDGAIKDHVDLYDRLGLPKTWGLGKSASADGTKYDVYEQNLLVEYHIRYGGYGGIAYHHVADSYIALFTSFIPCGTWEAIHILEGLLKNESTIQPDTLYADTQGQSATVFAFAYLLGIKLMPRIRGFKGMKFLKHDKDAKLKNLNNLFSHTANWDLIEKHWKDMIQVVLSVRSGKISSSMILRKLGNYSRKNHLYKAFRELGLVVRTIFLIEYITEPEVRRTIDSETNKVESFHRFSKWMSFGDDDTIRENDPENQEKIIKYNHLLANAVILQNAVDLENAIKSLAKKGVTISTDAQKGMSPYVTGHLKRFGPISVDLSNVPPPIESLH